MYTDLHLDFLPTPVILGTIESWQYVPETNAPSGLADKGLAEALASLNLIMWLPAYSVSQRMFIRYVCQAQVSMPTQEALSEGISPTWATVYSRIQKWCIL
jgi:hypothetical protein